jgi:cell division protein FtsB
LKPVASSYSASIAVTQVSPAVRERIAAFVPAIPNYVWLAMILLTATLLAFSTLWRSRGQLQTAQSRRAVTQSRLAQAASANDELKQQTQQLRTNPRTAAQAAQAQLHYVKRNEVVIATP